MVAAQYDFVPDHARRVCLGSYVDLFRSADGNILELGCGTRRILIPTTLADCEIVGLDISTYLLATCRNKL